MFSFPVVQPSFCFSYVTIITIPTSSFTYNVGHLSASKAALVKEKKNNAVHSISYKTEMTEEEEESACLCYFSLALIKYVY